MTNHGRIWTEKFTHPKFREDDGTREKKVHFWNGHPFKGKETRNFSIDYREADAGDDRTLKSLLDRLSTLYQSDEVLPVDVSPTITNIVTPESWVADITVRRPNSGAVWETRPLKNFLYLYYASRDQGELYDQLVEKFEIAGQAMTETENEVMASLQGSLPNTTELIEYLFGYVILSGENISLAIALAPRRNSSESLVKKLTDFSSTMQPQERLSYSQTRDLIDMGFKALDPSLFSEVNVRGPPPYSVDYISPPIRGQPIKVRVNPTKPSVIYVQENKVYEKRMDTEGSDWIEVIKTKKKIIDVAFSPDGKLLAVVEEESNGVVFYDAEQGNFDAVEVDDGVAGTVTTRVFFGKNIVDRDKKEECYVTALQTTEKKIYVTNLKNPNSNKVSVEFDTDMKHIAFDSKNNILSLHQRDDGWNVTLQKSNFRSVSPYRFSGTCIPCIGTDATDNFFFARERSNNENGDRYIDIVSMCIADLEPGEIPPLKKHVIIDASMEPIYFSSRLEELVMVTNGQVILPLTPDGIVYESDSNKNIFDASANEEYIALARGGINADEIVILIKKNY